MNERRHRRHRIAADAGVMVTLGVVALALTLAMHAWIVHPIAR
jgi:hypothetical protein